MTGSAELANRATPRNNLNRLELAGEAVRVALEALTAAAPGWLADVIGASWQQAYGQRICDLRLPESKAARAELAVRYARDGYYLLEHARSAATCYAYVRTTRRAVAPCGPVACRPDAAGSRR
jgi:hypothetical protein